MSTEAKHQQRQVAVHACSSPRLWNARQTAGGNAGFNRFIPTPVERTPLPTGRIAYPSIHPHACGTHIVDLGVRFEDS